MSTYDTWSKIGRVLMRGGLTKVEALETIDFLSQGLNGDSLPTAGARLEIDNFAEGQGSLTERVHDFIMSTESSFTSTYVRQCLQLSTRKDLKNLSMILGRFCKGENPPLERVGKQEGVFRRIDEIENSIDFLTASDDKLDIRTPFDLQDWVDFYPKNVVVVAGSPNAGKTAFMLKLAEMNMAKHEIFYFSSEMGSQELRLRLNKFERPIEDFMQVNWKERNSEFQDVIRPNAINIIDFMEIHDEFWKVGSMINKIFQKLNKGMAFIAIQKDNFKAQGVGGMMGLIKPRLYLNMSNGELEIIKAKNWADSLMNPNGKIFDFNLVQGHKFIYKGIRE